MVPFSEVAEHVASNVTLLCDLHHKEATNGLLTQNQITAANQDPYCRRQGISSPYGFHFAGDEFSCVIGGNEFTSRLRDQELSKCAIAVAVDDIDLIWFRIDQNGSLFLNANLFDESNLPLLVIHDNAMVYRTDIWDVEFRGRKLVLRQATRKMLLDISFRPPNAVSIERARLLCNGVEVLVRRSHTFVVNSEQLLVGCTSRDCDVGLQLGRNDRRLRAAFSGHRLSRYNLPASESNRRERQALKNMKQALADVGTSHELDNHV